MGIAVETRIHFQIQNCGVAGNKGQSEDPENDFGHLQRNKQDGQVPAIDSPEPNDLSCRPR